jgi:hypothetical protein
VSEHTETSRTDRPVIDDGHSGPGVESADRPSVAPANVADIESDIERTRADLAHTVDQLTAKLDVKARLRQRVATAKESGVEQLRLVRSRATDERGRPTPAALAVAGGVVALATAAVVLMCRHDNSDRR